MRKRRLVLATSALATIIGCGGSDKKPRIYANPKGSHYDDAGVPAADAGAGSAATDAGEVIPLPANPKGSLK